MTVSVGKMWRCRGTQNRLYLFTKYSFSSLWWHEGIGKGLWNTASPKSQSRDCQIPPSHTECSQHVLSWGGRPQHSFSAGIGTDVAPRCRQQRALCSWPSAHTLKSGSQAGHKNANSDSLVSAELPFLKVRLIPSPGDPHNIAMTNTI